MEKNQPTFHDKRFIAGAQKKPDGSLDTSKAMYLSDQDSTRLDKSRTQPDIKNQENQPEAWLDMEREQTYKQLINDITTSHEKGKTGGEYLAELVKKHILDYGTKVRFDNWLKPKDHDRVHFYILTSTSLNEVAGTRIERPLFIVDDEKLYQNIRAMFGSSNQDKTHGAVLPPGFFDNNTKWSEVGLIIVKNRETTAIHEVRHTVDPNVNKRTGYNRVISEIFAYYKEHVLDKEEPEWDEVISRVGHKLYHKNYSSNLDDDSKLTHEEFNNKIRKVIMAISKMKEKYGDLETQRKLAQSTSLEQLL